MRKTVAIGLMVVTMAAGAPSGLFAAAQNTGTVIGTARGSNLQALTNVTVQLRNTDTGEIVGTTTSNDAGAFSFTGLPAGSYIAEVIDASGKILGIGTPFTIAAGGSTTTSILALGGSTLARTGGGFSLFGMGPATSMTVLGAAAAASVAAVVTTRPNASPSR